MDKDEFLELLGAKVKDVIKTINNNDFYSYESGAQFLLACLLNKEPMDVAIERNVRIEEGQRKKADIIVSNEFGLSAIEIKFYDKYRKMGSDEAAAVLKDLLICRNYIDKQMLGGIPNDKKINQSCAILIFHKTGLTNKFGEKLKILSKTESITNQPKQVLESIINNINTSHKKKYNLEDEALTEIKNLKINFKEQDLYFYYIHEFS